MATGQDTRSIGELLRDLGSDTADLIRQELLLVRTEITTKVQASVAALVTMLAGGLVAFVALIVLLGAVVDGLTKAGLERWVAELIVGGSVTLVGYILVRVGQKALAASSLTPEPHGQQCWPRYRPFEGARRMNGGTNAMDHIERDLGRTRARLDANIDTLQQKFAPADLVDQAMSYFKEGGGMEFGRNLGRSVRENPVPIALIGVGLGWLMLSGKKQPSAAFDTSGGSSRAVGRSPQGMQAPHHEMPAYQAAAYEDLATKAHAAGAGVARQADESDDAFQERVHAAKAAVLGVTRDAGEAASAFGQRVEDCFDSGCGALPADGRAGKHHGRRCRTGSCRHGKQSPRSWS